MASQKEFINSSVRAYEKMSCPLGDASLFQLTKEQEKLDTLELGLLTQPFRGLCYLRYDCKVKSNSINIKLNS